MSPADQLQSVDHGEEVELREKGSRFLAEVFPVSDESAAKQALDSVRTRYPDASHHCWALRLGPPERRLERSDDDGEPGGTAGLPILGAIEREDLTDTLIVVTRYFGGTKLGKGGLVRAYGDAARLGLASTPRRAVWRLASLTIRCEYSDVGTVEGVLGQLGGAIHGISRDFTVTPTFRVTVVCSQAEIVGNAVVDATRGNARTELESECG